MHMSSSKYPEVSGFKDFGVCGDIGRVYGTGAGLMLAATGSTEKFKSCPAQTSSIPIPVT